MQMFLVLIAALSSAFAGAGIAYGLRRLIGERIPKWFVPAGAGLAMILTTISLEYSWARGVMATLPSDTVMIATREQRAAWQPWTYVKPWIKGFVAVTPSETVETVEGSGQWVVQTRLHERWQPAIIKPILVDCTTPARAEIFPTTSFDADGRAENADWLAVSPDDPLIAVVCPTLGG
jgi:hypothetical protein